MNLRASTDEDDIRRVVGENDTPLKLSVMADAERTDYHTDILPRDQSVLDLRLEHERLLAAANAVRGFAEGEVSRGTGCPLCGGNAPGYVDGEYWHSDICLLETLVRKLPLAAEDEA